MQVVLCEKNPPLAEVILNRPDKRNALSLRLIESLNEQLQIISEDENIKVVIIRGNGPVFSSGHDLTELIGDHNTSYYHHIFSTCTKMMQGISQLPQPVIAMVQGMATAAGCQLVASCDLAIAEKNAVFSTPGVKIGLFCATPMVPLCRLIGRRRALDMLLTGRNISALEAQQYGLINRVVPSDSLLDEGRKWAEDIAQFSAFTVQFGKNIFYKQVDMDEQTAYTCAVDAIVKNCMHDDAEEGIRSLLEKRKPKWKS